VKVLTTTLCYPTPAEPQQGIFVQRRAAALADHCGIEVEVASPQPWCPLLRRTPHAPVQTHPLQASYPKLLSVPVLNWVTDGVAYARAIQRFVLQRVCEKPFQGRARKEAVVGHRRKPLPHGHGSEGCPTSHIHSQKQRTGDAGFDLIDAHFVYPDGVGAWLAGRQLGIPVVVTVRGKIVSLSRRAIRRLQIRAMLRSVDARIAVSESLARQVHRIAGSDLPVDVIPNGVDAATFRPIDRARARRALGWDLDTRYVLSVGHLQRLKGFDRLVDVLPAVRACLGDVRLMLAGSRRGEPGFQAVFARRMAEVNQKAHTPFNWPCVSFVGEVPTDQLSLMYSAADLCVNASRSEGWSNAISESLAAGTPVVATDVGGNREQICSVELGTIVPDGDATALGVAIVAALSREWNRPLIAAHGAARGWDQVADEVYTVFKRVCTSPRERAATGLGPVCARGAERAIEVPG